MGQELLKYLANVQPSGARDLYSPYSFLEWKNSRPSVLEKDLYVYYNRYVLEWFSKNKQKKVSNKFLLRQKYLFLLDQLQLFFTTEEKNQWYEKINLSDEKELLLGIPYFAKKLKKIALYYLKLRKKLKNVKIKYNSIGSVRGIEQEIYQHILENFTSSNEEIDPDIQNVLPTIDALKNQLVIKVEEIYDDGEYMDKSPTAPLSAFVDIFYEPTAKLFSTKGIVLSSEDWIFNTFTFPTSSTASSFVESLTSALFAEERSDAVLYDVYVQAFLGENKFNLTFPTATTTTETYDVNIQKGNNYFYYPTGTTDASIKFETPLPLIALSAANVGGTSSKQLSSSDTIFVKNGNEIKAAWLYFKDYDDENKDVLSLIKKDSTTSFIFPFPGYGLSAEDIVWTGPTLETEDEYAFLSPSLQASVNEEYWSQILPSDSTTELKLVETTLVDDGARASKNPTLADKVFIREERNPDTTTPRGSLSGAWLYRFERAALPISTIEEQNNVVMWPYFRTDEYVEQKEFLNYLTTSKVLTGSCSPVSVQSLDSSLFVAATSFDLADKIYKLESYDKSLATEATECCWLSSAEIISDNRKYFSQKGASFLFEPAVATKFVWTGPTMSVGEAFQGINHMEDCPHAKNSNESWQTCTCKQIHYSPFGHSLETFEQGNRNADYVCLAPSTFSPDFDLNSWKDADNNTFKTSSQFAWYKTPSQWGNGVWSNASGNTSTLQLSSGYVYVYHRAGSRTETENPSYAVLKKFYKNTSCFPSTNGSEPQLKWITAKRTEEGIWEPTNEESQMIFYPGDFVKFEKQQNTTSFYLSTSLIENETENKGSIWSVSDVIAFNSAADRTNINWPLVEEPFALENYDKQAPPISTFANISAIVAWKVSCDEDPTLVTVIESPYTYSSALSTNVYQNIFTFTFVPPQTGTYSIAVTAVDNGGNTFNIPNNDTKIPSISVIPQYREELIDIQFTTPQASILLEHPLSGWNYTVSDIGAKPFWAILNCEKSSATKSKGIREWGFENTFFGGYIPNVVPKMSPLTINYGDVVDYERNGRDFYWTQPVVYRTFSNTPQWCKLNYDTSSPSNLSAVFDSGLDDTLKVFPTLSASDIVLSNNINGAPVEIFYYALNSFLWTTSATTTNELSAPVPVPYYTTSFTGTNIANRFYPSVAVVPTLDRTYTIQDSGGYFTPQHLGASQYINTNFTATLKNLELTGTYITEDTSVHIGGRGLTYEQQSTLYDWEENNEWLKEPPTTDLLAGTVKKELTKSLQTFIPYQTPSPENSLGITRTDYQFTPWGGKYADQWVDKTNESKGFTGVRNVSAWEASQELAKNNKEADCWITDIYGNQYGLFKSLSGVPVWQRPYINGELWVRTNGGTINPATKALSSVFDQFKQNNTIYNDLTSKQILAVDCFFDTLMIQTSGAFILSKITYDYDADAISLNTDDTRYKQLTADKFEFEQTWFLPEEKTIVCLFTETSATSFYPILYTYNLNNSSFNKIFPTTQYNTLKTTLSSYSPKEGRFVYNSSTRTYGITYNAKDANDDIVFINLKLKRLEDLELETIDVYENRNPYRANTMPPILLTQYLSAIPVAKNTTFTLEVSAYNNPTSYEIFQASSGVTELQVTSLGTFTGKLTSDGLHHINYSISNDVGSTYYALTLSAT